MAQSLDQPATRERQIRALRDAMRRLGIDHGLILTDANADAIPDGETRIEILSLAQWLLDTWTADRRSPADGEIISWRERNPKGLVDQPG